MISRIIQSRPGRRSPLLAAIYKGNELWTKRILSMPWVNTKILHDKYKVDAFFLAIYLGNFSIVKMFIDHGVNLNPAEGEPPLHLAIKYSSYEIIKLLIDNKASIHKVHNNKTPLQLAAEYPRFDIINLLMDGYQDEHLRLAIR